METYGGPLHDESSHGSDAFGEFAINCRIASQPAPPPKKRRDIWAPQTNHSSDWKVA
jgi:hypothetical protein